jgi:hypothetical protein
LPVGPYATDIGAEHVVVARTDLFGARPVWPRTFDGTPAVRVAACVGVDIRAACRVAGRNLLTIPSFLIAARNIARVAREALAASIPAIDNGGSAGAIGVACVRVADISIVATLVRRAMERVRTSAVRITGIGSAGVAVIAVGIDGLARPLDAIDATTCALGLIAYTLMLHAAPAVTRTAIAGVTTPTGSNARIAGATFRGIATAAKIVPLCILAASTSAAPCLTTTDGHAFLATFLCFGAEGARPRTAELFSIAETIATGVVTTFGMAGTLGISGLASATGRTALVRRRGRAAACVAIPGLDAGAFGWCGCGSRAPCGRGLTLEECASRDRSATEAEEALQHRAAAGAIGQ